MLILDVHWVRFLDFLHITLYTSAPFSQPHIPTHVKCLHHVHFSLQTPKETVTYLFSAESFFQPQIPYIVEEAGNATMARKQRSMCYYEDQMPMREGEFVARFYCVFFEGEGPRNRLKSCLKLTFYSGLQVDR